MKKIILLMIGLPGAVVCLGQHRVRHTFKTDLIALAQKRIGLGYELQLNRKTALEGQFELERHGSLPDGIFNGDQIANYTVRTVETIDPYYKFPVAPTSQVFLGEGRPLAVFPEHIPLTTLGFRAGTRFYFHKKDKPWRILFQPGVALRRIRFYEIDDATFVQKYYEEKWAVEASPYDFTSIQRTYSYRQTRAMRARENWFGGITYDFGLTCTIWRGFFLEARFAGGLNILQPYKPLPPVTARNVYLRPSLQAGYWFGRMAGKPIQTPVW